MGEQLNYDERDHAIIMASGRFDANEGMYFARELEKIKSNTYDVRYPELTATRIIPVSTDAGPGSETITYYQYDAVGFADFISNYSTDLPRVDLVGKKFSSIVKSLGDSYGYSIQDIRAAQMAGKPLEQRKANAARKAIEQKQNQIAYFGDSANNMIGLFSHPNVTVYTLPNDGTGTTATFKTKTPDQVLRDLNGMVNKIIELTKGAEAPNTMLMSYNIHGDLSTRARSSTSDTTILEFFLANSPYIKNIEVIPECATAGSGGTEVVMMYNKSADKLTLEIPQMFEQFPPQAQGLEFVIPCHARIGGVIIYYPLSLIKAEGC